MEVNRNNDSANSETPIDRAVRLIFAGRAASLAEALGVSPATVSCWKRSDRRPGELVGTIPVRYHARLLQIAKARGAEFTAADLMA